MTQVIIDDVIPRTQLIAAAGQTVFNTNWTANATTDVMVYARADGVEPDDETQLVSTSDYNVTFIGGSQTVRVTFLSGRTLDDVITIVRNTPAERMNLYVNTNFVPSMLNEDFGILTLVDQQAQMYDTAVTPRYNLSAEIEAPSTLAGGDLILPVLQANQIWAKNNDNDAIVAYNVPQDGALAPGNAQYLVQVADPELPNAQAMGALASGLVVNTNATGVQLTRLLAGVTNQTVITNSSGISGNPTIGLASNPTIPGTQYIFLPSGTTAQRPVTPVDGMVRYNTTLQALEVYEGSSWDSLAGGIVDSIVGTVNQIDVDNTDPQNPVLGLSSTLVLPGTMEAGGNVNMDSHLINNLLNPVSAQDAATKAYVDSIAAGFTLINPVRVASTGNLVATYDNGTSGVGATLTVTALGVASIDGVALSLNDRVLFKDQSTTYENGIYYVSDVGSGGTSAVYTRATDFDQPSEIDPGDLVPVIAGSTLAGTLWLQTATVTAVGTDPITFIQFAAAYTNVVTIDGTQTITGDKTFTGTTTLDNFIFDGNQMQHAADTNNYFEFGTDTQNFVTGGSSRMDLNDSGLRIGGANSRVTTILDEDNMDSNSATSLATQQSIKAYADFIALGAFKNYHIYTSSTSWSKPSYFTNNSKIAVLVVGAGGSSGGCGATGVGQNANAGGGGGGGTGWSVISSSLLASTETVTVGTGGSAPAAGNNNGNAGGSSSFGSFITCTGGSGGTGGAASSTITTSAGGTGGGSAGGDLNMSGSRGEAGGVYGGVTKLGGCGGNSILSSQSVAVGAQVDGQNYGAGGSGGTNGGSSAAKAGAAGANGLVVVFEYL